MERNKTNNYRQPNTQEDYAPVPREEVTKNKPSRYNDNRISKFNTFEWELMCWARNLIERYKADKPNSDKLRGYQEAKDTWADVMEGKYREKPKQGRKMKQTPLNPISNVTK